MQSNIKILIVDDEVVIRQGMLGQLNELGYKHIYQAKDSEEAMKIIDRYDITIVFLDIELKDSSMDGISLGRTINRKRKNTIIIFLTAFSDDDTLNRTDAVEHDNYLVKPVTLQQTYASIQQALTRSKSNKIDHRDHIGCPFSNHIEEIFIKLQNDKYYYRILIKDILYIQAGGKGIDIVTENKTFFTYSSLTETVKKINNPNIVQVHKKYVINRQQVSSISSTDIVMSNAKIIPIGRNFKDWQASDSIVTLS